MLRFSFSLHELPAELVATETTAYYRLDGTLRLEQGGQVVFEEAGTPLVAFVVWLSDWWASNQPARSYTPDGSDPDYGPMLLLAPTGGTDHCLTYTWADTRATCRAEQAQWGQAVTQLCEDLRQTVLERYHLSLDGLLASS